MQAQSQDGLYDVQPLAVRHVKCDEGKPGCSRCADTGRKCDGYTGTIVKPKQQKTIKFEVKGHDATLVPLSAQEFSSDSNECRSFHYFRTRTAPQLSGYYRSDLWDCLVPLCTHYHPAIKHAVVALASLHERFEQNDCSLRSPNSDIAQGGFALRQYNYAINYLTRGLANEQERSVDVCLIACILFAIFETLRGHYGSALSHINSGVKIFTELDAQEKSKISKGSTLFPSRLCVPLEDLKIVLVRLDAQSNELIDTPPMPLQPDSESSQPGFGSYIPNHFASLEEASNSLYYHRNHCLRTAMELFGSIHNDVSEDTMFDEPFKRDYDESCRLFQATFRDWNSAFQAFLAKYSATLDNKQLQGAAGLEISYLIASLKVEGHLQLYTRSYTRQGLRTQGSWDKHLSTCEEIVDLATTIINMEKATTASTTSNKPPIFSLEVSTIAHLFEVVHRCRDPTLRRRAIALLYSTPRQEGLYHSSTTGWVCKKIMEVEEAGLGVVKSAEDIPDCNRVSGVGVQFDMDGRRGILNLSRRRDSCLGSGLEVAEVETFREFIEL